MKRLITRAVILSAIFLMASCLSVESELDIRNDGGGTLKLSYRISRMVQGIGQVDSENTLVPLPVNEKDFRSIADENEGISLTDFSYESDDEYIYIDADLEFTDAEALSVLLGGESGDNVTFTADESGFALSQLIYGGLDGPMSEDSQKLLETYFSNDKIRCSVTAESNIKDPGIGTVGGDGKSAFYEATISEIVRSKNPVIFRVRW